MPTPRTVTETLSVKYSKISITKDLHVNHCDITGTHETE